jgi:putative phosphoesterase
MLVGVIADTHGYVDARLAAAFAGVRAIVHAGDVGGEHVLSELREMAPVRAVYGNNDEKLRGLGLPFRDDFVLGGVRFHLVHQLPDARPPEGTQVVVFGHSHKVVIEERSGVWHVNPGAAGRAGFHRVQTVAVMEVSRGKVRDIRAVELGAREAIVRTRSRRT